MRLIVLLALAMAVAFVVAVFWPRRSRRAQEKVKEATRKASNKSRRHAGRAGDATARTFEISGRAVQESARAGRRTHDRLFDTGEGAAQDRALERRYGAGGETGEEDVEPSKDGR